MFEKKLLCLKYVCTADHNARMLYTKIVCNICKYAQKIMINNKYNLQRFLRNVSLK